MACFLCSPILTLLAQAFPAIDYSKYIEAKDYHLFVYDWIVLLLVLVYIWITVKDAAHSLRAQSRIHDEVSAGVAMCRGMLA